jgi:DNA-binding PadR family transcriptional regulator
VRVKRGLLPGEWAALALLTERPAHGYELASALGADGEVGRIWTLPRQHVYAALSSLEALGLVERAGEQPGRRAPRRTVLRATAEAEALVRGWLDEPVRHGRDLQPLLLLKLSFRRRRGLALEALLRAQEADLAARRGGLAERLDGADDDERLVLRWRLGMTDAALGFVRDSLDEAGATSLPVPDLID